MNKLNIVCVGYFHGAGGAERQIVMLANELLKRGHSVTLIALAEYNNKFQLDSDVKLVNLAEKTQDGIFSRFIKFKRAIKSIKPDLIINFWFQSSYFSVFLPKKYRGKIIYAERGDPGDSEYDGLLGIIRKFAFKRINGFVFQSNGAKDYFNDKVKEKSVVIPNSVSIPYGKYSLPLNREKRIVTMGRLHPQKNHKLLIDAFSKISDSFPEFTLEIYGDGELHDELLQQVNKLGLNDRVFLFPSTKDIFEKIRTASLFVLTSDYEGMPNALMEAMALGLPCISTDCRPGGAKDLIEDGKNGIIVPVRDVENLSLKMEYLLKNPIIAEEMATNAQAISITHTSDKVFDDWDTFCVKVASQYK